MQSQNIFQKEIDLEAFVEELFPMQESDIDYNDLYESLLQVHLNPIDLQKATAEELHALYSLSPLQIQAFMAYKNEQGPFLSIHELQAIPHWDLETIQKVLPFVTLSIPAPTTSVLKRFIKGENGYLLLRHRRVWEQRKGYTPPDTLRGGNLSSRYSGDPNDFYTRFRISEPGNFSFGLTADKDAGEPLTWSPDTRRYGFNFLSYHYTLYNRKRIKTLTLGDYQLQSGQGLVFGSGFSVGKGTETISTIRRSTLGIRPYTSVLESGFFRGMAATYSIRNWEITALYSNAPRDANVQLDTDSLDRADEYLSSLLLSGLHRTPHEISSKARAREINMGGSLHFQSLDNRFQLGTNHLFTQFSHPLIPRDRIYNRFEFRGKENQLHSVYFSYNLANHFIFGESALSGSGGMGLVLGTMSSLNPKLDFSAVWRKFDRNFHSFYGNAFSEGSRPINEEGFYFGLHYRPHQKINWSAYFDLFKFPWMRFRIHAPSSGREWLTKISFKPDKKLAFFFQWREEIKSRNLISSDQNLPFYQLAEGKRKNYVLNLNFIPATWWQVKSRVQFSSFNFNGQQTKGFAIAQDLHGVYGPFKFGGRMALFDTDDFENRQYVYEKNVLWAFSVPNYYGQGVRYYLLTHWKVNNNLSLWLRWAKTIYSDRETISSGLQEIDGHKITETTFQLRYLLK
ncbi:MAG: helix-hairpin-helix domain-containing protein [Cyclobacteriaceae bacterium]